MTALATNFHLRYEQSVKVDAFVLYVRGPDFVVDVKYRVTMSHYSKDIYRRRSPVSLLFH